jgi:hypothetical protein
VRVRLKSKPSNSGISERGTTRCTMSCTMAGQIFGKVGRMVKKEDQTMKQTSVC